MEEDNRLRQRSKQKTFESYDLQTSKKSEQVSETRQKFWSYSRKA